jgi:hypothetical protein
VNQYDDQQIESQQTPDYPADDVLQCLQISYFC